MVTLLIGKAYQYFFWDPPLRSLLWDEKLLSSPIELLTGKDWATYVSDYSVDSFIRYYACFVSILFILAIISSFLLRNNKRKWIATPLYLSSGILFFHSLLEMKENYYHIGQFFERTIQFTIPVLFALYSREKLSEHQLLIIFKIIIAITFAAHGAYAAGLYPVPGHFVDMVINILGISESSARNILLIAGILDIVLLVALFIPKVTFYAIWYATIWGLMTSFARLWYGIDFDFIISSIHQSIHLTVFRLPHGLIPLSALMMSYTLLSNKKMRSLKLLP